MPACGEECTIFSETVYESFACVCVQTMQRKRFAYAGWLVVSYCGRERAFIRDDDFRTCSLYAWRQIVKRAAECHAD